MWFARFLMTSHTAACVTAPLSLPRSNRCIITITYRCSALARRPPISSQDGGTQVTVRGVRFGTAANDIVDVTVCGVSCLPNVLWESAQRIKLITPPGKGSGPVVITTKSGGVGRCDLEFRYETVVSGVEEETVGAPSMRRAR